MIDLLNAAKLAGVSLEGQPDWAEVVTKIAESPLCTNRTIEVPPGDWTCRSTMRLGSASGSRPIRLIGDGPVDHSDRPGRGAVFRWSAPPAEGSLVEINAPSTTLERLRFQGLGAKMLPAKFGIETTCAVEIRNCVILNIACTEAALSIEADNNRAAETKGANLWRLEGVHVRGVWGPGAGIRIRGGDANAGLAQAVDCSDVQQGPGIWDDSFLGNTWVGCHVHQAETNQSPPYLCEGRSSRSRFLGCYTEGYVPSHITPPSIWIGGQGRVAGGCTILSEGRMTNVALVAPTIRSAAGDLPRVARIEIDGTGDFWTLDFDKRLSSPHNGWLRFLYRAASAYEVFAINQKKRR